MRMLSAPTSDAASEELALAALRSSLRRDPALTRSALVPLLFAVAASAHKRATTLALAEFNSTDSIAALLQNWAAVSNNKLGVAVLVQLLVSIPKEELEQKLKSTSLVPCLVEVRSTSVFSLWLTSSKFYQCRFQVD